MGGLLITFLLGWVVGGCASHNLFTGVGGGWGASHNLFTGVGGGWGASKTKPLIIWLS